MLQELLPVMVQGQENLLHVLDVLLKFQRRKFQLGLQGREGDIWGPLPLELPGPPLLSSPLHRPFAYLSLLSLSAIAFL